MAKNKGGRPTKMTEAVIQKLEHAYALDCTDAEACLFADISPATLYNYQNAHPEFLERKEQLKQTPMLKARQSIVDGIEKDPKLALDYARNKRKNEFSTQQNTQQLDADGNPADATNKIEVVFVKTDRDT